MSAGYKEYFLAVVFFFAVAIGALPILVSAQANVDAVADQMCNPVLPACPCGQVMGQNGCQQGTNMFMCACAGPHASGICDAPNHCKATSFNAQSGQSGGAPDMSQLMQAISQLMQAMKGSDSGSGSGSGAGGSGGCATFTQTSNATSTDPCSYYAPGSGSTSDLLNQIASQGNGSDAGNQLISSLFGSGNTTGNGSGNSGSVTPLDATSSVNAITAATQNIAEKLDPGTSATVSQSVFGAAQGITGDIQVISGNRATVLASNRDVTGNRQTSGFWGFGIPIGQSPQDMYIKLCEARPWSVNFINIIIPASYLDNLCTSHSYPITPPTLAPSVVVTTPAPKPPPPPTPPYLGPMKADIWASPPAVSSGSRTSIFWNASGILSCTEKSADNVFSQNTLSGNASSQPLTKNTAFSIVCQSATSSVSNQVVVTVQ